MNNDFLQKAAAYCERYNYRLTPPRQAVLKIIFANDKPVGAYEILQQLGASIPNPKPPTAYRAIEFWQEHGFIHRIESLNAYVACEAGHQHTGSQFLICGTCGNVTETHLCNLPEDLIKITHEHGFQTSKWNVELHGTCSNCT